MFIYITVQKLGVTKIFWKKNFFSFFFSKDDLNWSKVTVKAFFILQNISISK